MPIVTTPVRYKAVFERTYSKPVEGKSKTVTEAFEDPDSPTMVSWAEEGERGYLIVTEAGTHVLGMATSANAARATMKACRAGNYNPFPPVKNRKTSKVGE
jgi:hypothetical protein